MTKSNEQITERSSSQQIKDNVYCIGVDKARAQQNENAVFETFTKAFQMYKPNEILLSFNGGKDCTVLLHLLTKFYQNRCLEHIRIPVLYIQTEQSFDEIETFVTKCSKHYNVELIKRCGSIKAVLTDVCAELPHVKAVFMGCRRTDPYCDKLTIMQATDPGWPALMRINPILDWNCRDIWDYIFTFQVPYCSLYERGYTSIGSKLNTKPNPRLVRRDEATGAVTYGAAYELADEDALERAGRV